jgi:lysophospholipase L1-like esterase
VASSSSAPASASPSPSSGATDAGGLYVALGDSLAAGYQPGGAELRDTAYPALTANRLSAAGDELTLENLGCSGETTTSLVKGGKCDFAAGSQLEQAEKLLKGSDDVALVTLDIGGNDLLRCVRGGAQIDTSCVRAGVRTVEKNLPRILERLRTAAGPDVPVLVLGYYNPWLAAKALDQPVKGVDAAAKAYTGLSAAIEAAAKASGTTFVSLDDAFSTNDTTPTTINGRSVPENAAKICTLTNICTARDIHLTDEGAATVARVLSKAAEKAGVS